MWLFTSERWGLLKVCRHINLMLVALFSLFASATKQLSTLKVFIIQIMKLLLT